ncbi:MAG TPA: undecaprenyl-diphosphate phosphatase [Bryobacteraceae bacterium]|jgi:undecaprenyl-diphosphatase|nr:undecaprenyl-diphosphate phosphatase [Bryobacteraceae bacterium]
MFIVLILILAIIQGLAELLPVSSSAHVVVAEKLMGLDPSSPQMTLVLVMLHTGTMFAVIVYFWKRWHYTYFQTREAFKRSAILIIIATILTGIVGEAIIKIIEKTAFSGYPHAEIELLFSHLELIAPALAAAGILILFAGLRERRRKGHESYTEEVTTKQASLIGIVQGLCLPFRGFSRSGATISTGMLAGASRERSETFSFALAVVLTPAVIGREALRLIKAEHISTGVGLGAAAFPAILGAVFSFFAGLLALKWLSSWLEAGRWYLFGIYCLVAAAVVEGLHLAGY